jgi:hypothetical protein
MLARRGRTLYRGRLGQRRRRRGRRPGRARDAGADRGPAAGRRGRRAAAGHDPAEQAGRRQDFRVKRKLADEAAKMEQEIIVEVSGQITDNGLQQLNTINGKVSWQNETRLRFAIKNPKPGLIEKLCKEVGLTVVAMKRIRIGRISMSSLPVGEWRYLQDHERF